MPHDLPGPAGRTLLTRAEDALLDEVFGDVTEPIGEVERRARVAFTARRPIVWEGDAQTFQFSYVGPHAQTVLGWPVERWTNEATFWADTVCHPDDRNEAVAYCALATGQRAHHAFEYRALHADGRLVWLYDVVRVVLGQRGLPVRLRGLMFDISDEKRALGAFDQAPREPLPSRSALLQARP